MTRFIYIADTHLGANPMGYQQQKGYPDKLKELVSLMDEWIRKAGNVDFILHGGDMIDGTSEDNIRNARELFRLPVPVYLCLGNHDLTVPMALDMWLDKAPEFFPDNSPNYSIEANNSFIHVVPNHWGDKPFYWEVEQNAHFLPDQIIWLMAALAKRPDAPHILCTHSPFLGVPGEQTGFSAPYHDPGKYFFQSVLGFCRCEAQIKCTLSGHNHINMHLEKAGVHYVTVSGFVETPFELKVIEFDQKMLKLDTVNLLPLVDFKTEYDFNKTYVQGRGKDRSFEAHWR